jgi:hypothetical protein
LHARLRGELPDNLDDLFPKYKPTDAQVPTHPCLFVGFFRVSSHGSVVVIVVVSLSLSSCDTKAATRKLGGQVWKHKTNPTQHGETRD